MKSVFNLLVLSFSFALAGVSCLAKPVSAELQILLPTKIGGFRQIRSIRPLETLVKQGLLNPDILNSSAPTRVNGAEAEYRIQNGKPLFVELVQFSRDADAYSLLTIAAEGMRVDAGQENALIDGRIGTAGAIGNGRLVFYKGRTFVRITGPASNNNEGGEALEFARLLSDQLDKSEGEIPVLVKHLPDWEEAQKRALYFAGFKSLQAIAPEQTVLSVLDSVGDADAVVASYGAARVTIVEFNTPQLAADNDRVISAKLQELRTQNQPVPSAYRRVGNYTVFVFNAPSDQIANALIDKIQYEQVVQWLGDNPYWFKEAQRRYTETTLGVLVAVVKASGLTLIGCFGLGGLLGGVLFARRRARQATTEAFSDAGGMLRLNLDEMTAQTDPARLLPGRQ